MKKYLSILLLLAPLFVFGQTQIKFDHINPTLPANFKFISNGKYFGADTAYFGNVLTHPVLSGTFQFAGDSFVTGTGASPLTLKFSTQLSALMGLTESNHGAPGISLQFVSTNLSTYIPTKAAGDLFLFMCWGQNDIQSASSYTEHQFALDWATTLNYCLAHGWSANQIWLSNIGFNWNPTAGSYTAPQYAARQAAFSFCVDSIAAAYGCLDVRINQLMHYGGSYQLVATDLQHPSTLGHTQIAKLAYNTYYTHIFQDGHQLEADGLTQLNQLSLPKIPTLPIGATVPPQLLGITKGDTVGRLTQLPTGIGTAAGGVFNVNGQILQQGWVTPSGQTLGTFDIGVNELARIASYYTPNTGLNLFNYLQLMDNGANINLVVGGSSPPGKIQMSVNGVTSAIISGTKITSPVDYVFTSLNKKIFYDDGSNAFHGGLTPLNSSGYTILYNAYFNGALQFQVSNGSDNGSLVAGNISKIGNWVLANQASVIDNGFKLDVVGDIRASASTNYGTLGVVNQANPTGHTTGGSLAPATYFAKVVPVDAFGNTGTQTLELSTTTTGATSSIDYSWTALANATSYRVYIGTTTGGENVYLPVSGTSVTYTGSGTTGGALPTQNKTTLGLVSSLGAASFTSVTLKSYTVSTLPTPSTGMMAAVTDASSPTWGAIVSGGGSTYTSVIYNGTNWIVQ